MTLASENRAGLATWRDGSVPYSVILAPDFGTTSEALEAWDHYKENLGEVRAVLVTRSGIEGLPVAEDLLASFLALGSTGTALALSGTNCGYGGEGPHGSARILRELGVSDALVDFVFRHRRLRFELLEDRWIVEVDDPEGKLKKGWLVEK